MNGVRLEVDFDKVASNARVLVDRTAALGISVTGVTKATLGSPDLAAALCRGGVSTLGDSRIENIERMLSSGVQAPMLLIRSPMPSQVDRIVESGAMSVNTDLDALSMLAASARSKGRVHDVMVMVELGDLREGVMPAQLHETVRHVLDLPTLRLRGIGANLACRNGIEPSDTNMADLTEMVEGVEAAFGIKIGIVSGGNSANLEWACSSDNRGRINDLRLGEAVLLGREPLHRRPIAGLHTDAFTVVAEVIESKRKPTKPWGSSGQNSFGEVIDVEDRGVIWQTILAVGRQDTDTSDLSGPDGVDILAASSDHLITETRVQLKSGDEVRFEPGYSALLRSMTSPLVRTVQGTQQRKPEWRA